MTTVASFEVNDDSDTDAVVNHRLSSIMEEDYPQHLQPEAEQRSVKMVMEVGRDNSRGSDDNNPFREAMEVINALAEEGDFEFEQAERMAQQQQAVEDQRHRRTLAPENPPPRQNAPHSFGLQSLRDPSVADAENYGLRMTNGDADDEEEEDGGEEEEEEDDDASSGGDSVILLPRGISSPRRQIERKREEEEEQDGKGDMMERRDGEEEKENSENGATVEVRRVNAVPQAPANTTSNTNPLEEIPLHPKGSSAGDPFNNLDKILEPSPSSSESALFPCHTCGRTFLQKALERHANICQKNQTKKPRQVFNVQDRRMEGNPVGNISTGSPGKKKTTKIEDEFKKCPHCERKFGPKPFDRHVAWCAEKMRRMSNSPKKDMLAIAKLQARTGYRAKTPRSGRDTASPALRKPSVSSTIPSASPAPSLAEEIRMGSCTPSSVRRKSSGGRSRDVSSINDADHTRETEDTYFIRAVTGRGSIRKGPAPTKASQLRQLAKAKHDNVCAMSSASPSTAVVAPVSRTNLRQRQSLTPTNSGPAPGAQRHGVARSASLRASKTANRNYAQPSPSAFGFQPVVKPSVVKPSVGRARAAPTGYRREPEGIEHGAEEAAASKMSTSMITPRGSYDHSAEYDPYQSAADQMQELLFGATSTSLIKPSSNSAFQKYVPSTSDINTKMNACKQPAGTMFSSMHEHHASSGGHHGYGQTPSRVNFVGRTSGGSNSGNGRAGGGGGNANDAKVARFCHECGNPFALPSIRFCCECGVKRLYC